MLVGILVIPTLYSVLPNLARARVLRSDLYSLFFIFYCFLDI